MLDIMTSDSTLEHHKALSTPVPVLAHTKWINVTGVFGSVKTRDLKCLALDMTSERVKILPGVEC